MIIINFFFIHEAKRSTLPIFPSHEHEFSPWMEESILPHYLFVSHANNTYVESRVYRQLLSRYRERPGWWRTSFSRRGRTSPPDMRGLTLKPTIYLGRFRSTYLGDARLVGLRDTISLFLISRAISNALYRTCLRRSRTIVRTATQSFFPGCNSLR